VPSENICTYFSAKLRSKCRSFNQTEKMDDSNNSINQKCINFCWCNQLCTHAKHSFVDNSHWNWAFEFDDRYCTMYVHIPILPVGFYGDTSPAGAPCVVAATMPSSGDVQFYDFHVVSFPLVRVTLCVCIKRALVYANIDQSVTWEMSKWNSNRVCDVRYIDYAQYYDTNPMSWSLCDEVWYAWSDWSMSSDNKN